MENKVYKIMVVDDSPAMHMIIARAVKSTEFEICAYAKNGIQAIEMFKTTSPDAITMDITMPIMNGLEASKAILKINPDARIVMLSAMGDEELLGEANSIGVRIFTTKPFSAEELLQALKVAISS
jgi:two-component system chemotaxis response regulator CheY